MNKRFSFFAVISVCVSVAGGFSASPAEALPTDETLNEGQKLEKKLLFEQEVVQQQIEQARQRWEAAKAAKKNWVAQFSALYGYESNVNVNSSRRGDGFFQENLEGSYTKKDEKGSWGFKWYSEFYNYENFEASDYQNLKLSPFIENKWNDQLALKTVYDLNFTRYPNDDQLTYTSHKIKPSLVQTLRADFSHLVYYSYEFKDFRDKKALSVDNLPLDHTRGDHTQEMGYTARAMMGDNLFLSLTGALKWNNSNDRYNDTNDYSGYKVSGFAFRQFTEKASAVAVAGWDHKDYDSRRFEYVPFEDRIENSDLIYLGGYLYYDFRPNQQLFLSYIYKQNYSNDAAKHFSGYTVTSGVTLTF